MTRTIGVVMTAYNASATIAESVRSVLDQDVEGLELIVVDDGSTDGTAEVVRALADTRLRLETPGRLGRSAAVNWAIQTSNADLIAINDADDLAVPGRFDAQRSYLKVHGDVDVLGGQMIAFWDDAQWQLAYPTDHDRIVSELERGRMPLAHGAIMFSRTWFLRTGGLDTSLGRVEDFDLYYRHRHDTRFAALPTNLIRCRFKTLSFEAWRVDDAFLIKASGRRASATPDRIRYAKYRAALWSQKRGWSLTPRGGPTGDTRH